MFPGLFSQIEALQREVQAHHSHEGPHQGEALQMHGELLSLVLYSASVGSNPEEAFSA